MKDSESDPVTGKDEAAGANPYSSPVAGDNSWQGGVYPVGGGSFVRQIKPLCICMIIQGVLELLMGILYVGLGLSIPIFIMSQQGPGGQPAMPPGQQQSFQTMFGLIYGVLGGVVLLCGIFRIVAGWRGLCFRSYGVVVASLFVGLLDILSCYCLPTSVGLCVWGCIILFKPEVKQAFMLGAEGHKPAEIEESAWQGFQQ